MGGIEINRIEYLRANLRDRYKNCYAVLKELIQNADDAGATELHIAAIHRLDRVSHALLQGPLLVVVNNAAFTYRDSCAIHQAGMGSKGLEEDKIGKFGLGLKSVFHLCEAFFYLSDPHGDEEEAPNNLKRYGRSGILNPWLGEERYSSWIPFSLGDQERIGEMAVSLLSEQNDSWFAICLPLRRKNHCIDSDSDDPACWAIDPKWYGDQPQPPTDIFSHAHFDSICGMLPMMSKLSRVCFWELGPTAFRPSTPVAEIVRRSLRHVDWRTMGVGRQAMAGVIHLNTQGTVRTRSYVGIQHRLERQDLQDLSKRGDWPWMDAQTQSGRQRQPATAKQHAAVVLMETAGGGNLQIERAVFLPLGDPAPPRHGSGGVFDYEILLHGYFFVDAGRLCVDFAPRQEEETARQEWNRILDREATLPLIIPALAEYADSVKGQKDGPERMEFLTTRLEESSLVAEHAEQICGHATWAYRLCTEGGRWCQTDAALPLASLPGDGQVTDHMPFTVFPALRDRATTLLLTFDRLPRLASARQPAWDARLVADMFASVPVAEVAKHDDQLNYLVDIAREFCRRRLGGIHPELQSLLRRMLRDVPLAELRKQKEKIAELVTLLPASMIVPVPFKQDLVRESERLLESLIRQRTNVLPVPDLFCDAEAARPREATTEDVRSLLAVLSELRPSGAQEDAFHSLRGQAIAAILAVWKQGEQCLVEEFGDLPLFYVKDYAHGRRRAATANELRAHLERRLLFGRNAALCKKLQECLLTAAILFVAEKEMTDLLANAIGPIPSCDVSGCAALLELRPALNTDIAARRSLLSTMLPALADTGNSNTLEVLRYLLHGNPQDVSECTTLFITTDDAWCAAARWALVGRNQTWRLIPAALTDLKPSDATRLGVRQCDASSVPPLFRGTETERFDSKVFADRQVWRRQLIREWPDTETDTLTRLPLFVRTDGVLTPITEQTFIQGDFPPPPAAIFPGLVLIVDESGTLASRRLAPTLSAENILRKILAGDESRQHWQYILESIPDTVSSDLERDLQTTAWVPGWDGQGIAPRRIVSRTGLHEHVSQLRRMGKPLIHERDLPAALLEHPRWPLIKSLGPRGDELYRLIGESLTGLPAYAVGRDTVQPDDLPRFLRLFEEPDGMTVMPAADLISRLLGGRAEVTEMIERHILPAVRAPLDTSRNRRVLVFLATRYERLAGSDRNVLLQAFNLFLRESLEHPDFGQHLKGLRFLNQENRWCSAEQLAPSGDNVAPSHLLHASHFRVFVDAGFWQARDGAKPSIAHDGHAPDDHFDPDELAVSAKRLGDYLETWRSEEVPDDALAAVVAVLGNCDGYPEQYERFRDTRPLEAMRSHFKWHFTSDVLNKWMDKYHYCILPASSSCVRARNLFGEGFDAPVNKRLTSLFDGIGGPGKLRCFHMPDEHYCFPIWLRQISPDDLFREDRLNILANSVRAIRSAVYNEWDDDFASEWQQLIQVGQLEIEIAQDMILESSAMLLESQLSVRQSPQLKAIFTKWHRVRQRAKTAEHTKNDAERKAAEQDKAEVLEQLRSLLARDAGTQQLLRAEVCKKLKDNSYSASSIPFELFQNADDAVVELETLCEDRAMLDRIRPTELRNRFCIEVIPAPEKAVLRFSHWGRGINQFRIGTADGRDRDFDRDMERMLVLQGSGKDEPGGETLRTGKFGLGFKSVFFVCDEPQVLSGARSRFRVLAGIYPDRLASEDERRLEQVLEAGGDARHTGTVVELSLRELASVDQCVGTFQQLAAYLVVFARRIRRCNLCHTHRSEVVFEWQPSQILPGVECGTIRTGPGNGNRALVFRLGPEGYGALLVPIGSGGVDCEANTGVPRIWVTTPTEHSGPGPLVVNGPFDVNPGRTQLRDTPQNKHLALQMGQQLGDHLCRLYDACQSDWDSIRRHMGCPEASQNDFWSSLWNACLPYTDEIPVLQQLLFGSEHNGMYRLAQQADVIPTELPGEYGCLTSLKKIQWRTEGALADDTLWLTAAQIAWVRKNVQPGSIIAHSVGQKLDRFCHVGSKTLTLAKILHAALDETQSVTPEMANDLGRLIFPSRLREILSDRVTTREGEAIRDVLAPTRFRTLAGGWDYADQLLIGHAPENRGDEHRRAAFAPTDKLLAEQYRGAGLEFFLACRGERQTSAKQMAQWLLNADTEKKRRAGLEFLERGESFALRQCLTEDERALNASWLGDRSLRQQVMIGMDADRQAVILGMLRKASEIRPAMPPPAPHATRPAVEILRDVLAWWRMNRDDILAYHDRMVYPARRLPRLCFTATQAQLESDVAIRKEWLVLFMLGAMHRIGRATRQQDRGFLDLCEENGWLDDLAASTSDPAHWFRVMDDYLDSLQGEARYFHWINQFLAYYQLARWLPNYVRAFEAVTRPGVNLADLRSMRDIADLRTSHIFAGSTGFDAPPCSRTMGAGAHFVLREVIRVRAAQSDLPIKIADELARLAFVPSAVLRRLFAQITRNTDLLDPRIPREQASCRMTAVLREHLGEDAAFDQAFDVPLIALTWRRFADDRTKILGIDDGQSEEDPVGFLCDDTDNEESET